MKKQLLFKKLSVLLVLSLLLSIFYVPSTAFADAYSNTVSKTFTLKPGDNLNWILVSKANGETPLTYEILGTKGVKKDEKITIGFVDDYNEYIRNVSPVKKGEKDKIGSYAMKSSTFGTFVSVNNSTSGTVKIKLTFKTKSGKKTLKSKEYTIDNYLE